MAENANELPLADRQDMGLLGSSSQSNDPSLISVVSDPAVNAAGRPYDPATGRLLPSAAAEPAPEVTNVRTTMKHSAELYDGAAYFGISEAEADTIEGPVLRKMLRTMSGEHDRARDASERARFWEQQRGPKPENQPRPAPQEDTFDLGDELDPTANPKTHSALKKLWEENRELKDAMRSIAQRDGDRTQQAHFDAWDDAFEKLGDPRFGEGTREDADGEALQLRQTLIQAAGIDMSKQTPAQSKRLLLKAYKTLYPDGAPAKKPTKPADVAAAGYGGEVIPETRTKPTTPAKKPVISQGEWNRGGVGAPTSRTPEQLPEGRERAIAAVAAKMGTQAPTYDQDQEIKSTLLRRNGTPGA